MQAPFASMNSTSACTLSTHTICPHVPVHAMQCSYTVQLFPVNISDATHLPPLMCPWPCMHLRQIDVGHVFAPTMRISCHIFVRTAAHLLSHHVSVALSVASACIRRIIGHAPSPRIHTCLCSMHPCMRMHSLYVVSAKASRAAHVYTYACTMCNSLQCICIQPSVTDAPARQCTAMCPCFQHRHAAGSQLRIERSRQHLLPRCHDSYICLLNTSSV